MSGTNRPITNSTKGKGFLSGVFGWMGSSRSNSGSTGHLLASGMNDPSLEYDDDLVTELYALKHDPSAYLTNRSVTEANIDVLQTTNKMKKTWHQYESLDYEEQMDQFTKLIKYFPVICHKCDTSFQSIFGDGQVFTITLNVRFLTDSEAVLTHVPHADRVTMWRPLVDFFFSPSHIGCEMLDTLTVISERRSLLTLMSQTQLSSCLIRYLDVFYHIPFTSFVDNASFPDTITLRRLRSIQNAMAFLVRRLVRQPILPADIMNTDSMTTLINVLKSKDGPSEHQHIKVMLMEILSDILQRPNIQFTEYLHKKQIVVTLLGTLKHTSQDDAEVVEVVIEALVLILKRTVIRGSNQIAKDFANANGYQIVQDAILECEEVIEKDFDKLRRLFKLTSDLVFVGEGYAENSEGKKIKSQGAFQAIANTFARAKHDTLRKEVVDNILFIFAEHLSNYRAVEDLGTVAWFIHYIDDYSEDTQISVLKLLEFIVAGLNYVPKDELNSLVDLLRASISPSLAVLILNQISKFIQFNIFMTSSLREAQLFEVISHLLSTEFEQIMQNEYRASTTQKSSLSDLFDSSISILIGMLDRMPENIRAFREAGGIVVLQKMLLHDNYRELALKVFQTIILQDTHSIDVNILIEILQTAPRSNINLKIGIFGALGKMFKLKESAKDAFREAGFMAAISIIINTPWPSSDEVSQETELNIDMMLQLFDALFATLAGSLTNHPLNKSLLTKLIGATAITDALKVNGILRTEYSVHAFQCLLDFATERSLQEHIKENTVSFGKLTITKNARILNPHAFRFIIMLLSEMDKQFRCDMMRVFEYLSRLTPVNLEALASIELVAYIFEHFSIELANTHHPVQATVLKIVERLGCYRLTQYEWRSALRFLQSKEHLPVIHKFLVMAAKDGSSTPFVEMEPDSDCCIVSLQEKSWGSNLTGYTYGCWFYFNVSNKLDSEDRSEHKLFDILGLHSEDKKSYLKVSIREDGFLEVKTAPKLKKIVFSNYVFQPKRWYNVVITHKKYRLQGSSISLHVNGVLFETQKTTFVTCNSSGGSKMRGNIGKNPKQSETSLRMGSCFMYEDILGLNTIASIFVAGPSYSGYYQGNYVSSMHLLSEHLYTNFIKLLQNQGTGDNLSPSSDIEAENALKVMAHPLSEEKFVFCFNAKNCALRDVDNYARDNVSSSGIFLESLHTDNRIPRVLLRNAQCCCPIALSDEILNCDGLGVVMAMIERADTPEFLYDSLSLLNNLMLDSPKILNEMERLSAYDMVGSFLRRKGYLVNEAIHDLLWNMVLMGSSNGKELVTNLKACLCLLLDFEIWKKASPTVQQKLFHKMSLLISQGVYKRWNALRFDKIGLVPHLLHMLTHCPPIDIMDCIADVIAAQLSEKMTVEHVNYLKEFLLLTLDSEQTLGSSAISRYSPIERRRSLSSLTALTLRKSSRKTPLTSFLRISSRNLVLKMMLDAVKTKSANLDKLYKTVDYKWFYQFINEKSHPVSAVIAIQLWCCVVLYNPTNLNNERMISILKKGLLPYCNQFDMYQTLFSLILSRYARFNDKSDYFEGLLKGKEQKASFLQLIPTILNMLMHSFKSNYVPSFDNLSLHSYFNEVGPSDCGKSKWRYFKLGAVSNMDEMFSSIPKDDTSSGGVDSETSFYSEKSSAQQSLRRDLTSAAIIFIHTLQKTSPSFLAEFKKPEVLEDLVAVMFANAAPKEQLNEVSKTITGSVFEQHDPINEQLFSLINDIIVSELSSSTKGTSTLEDVLSSCPIQASNDDCAVFRSIVVENLINYFSRDENARALSDNSKLATNISYFSLYVADMYRYEVIPNDKYKLYIRFIIDMALQLNAIEASAQRSKSKWERNFMQFTSMLQSATSDTTGINIDPLALTVRDVTVAFRALNKMILYLLTMTDDVESTMRIMDALLTNNWLATAMDPNNKERDFYVCLCFVLNNALSHQDERIKNRGICCWRIIVSAQKSLGDNLLGSILTYKNENELISLMNGFNLLMEKDSSFFVNWYNTNPVVAPFFESRLGVEARSLMETDRKAIRTAKSTLFQTGRSRSNSALSKKEKKALETYSIISKECQHAFNVIKEQGDTAAKTKVEQDVIRYKYAFDQWNAFKRQLYMERAVWYDKDAVKNFICSLDSTEGPQRIRKKFEILQSEDKLLWTKKSQAIGIAPESTDKSGESPKFLIDQYKKLEELQLSPKGIELFPTRTHRINSDTDTVESQLTEHDDDDDSESNDHSDNTDALIESQHETSETENTETTFEEDLQEDLDFLDEEMGEYFKIIRLLEQGENMSNSEMFNSLKVIGLDGQKGIFVVCQHNMYIIDNFMLTKDEKIIEVDGSHVTSATFDDVPQSPSTDTSTSGGSFAPLISHHVIKLSYPGLTQVLKRRYLLRVTALEFFCEDGRNYFVVFEKNEMHAIYDKIVSHPGAKKINKGPTQKQMTASWQKGEVSNFEYLMYLNTLAGRSYNDLTQYPVFPWILKEYQSETIDLNDSSIYRDLSKPMGAQTEERALQFTLRFGDWPMETGIPKFHYGSHYSSAGIILHYLMRIEPFTTQSIELQGGKFDHADRMFHSIHDTWTSASTDFSMADVKELIPEFFFLPEFLVNTNDVDFGQRQNHSRVNNVVLPTWANGDPFEFIRIHRQALESDFVSDHINDWIDLIFGYKQKGKDAEEAVNLYYYLTYEGAVDIDAIQNEVDKQATIAQISNFGQTPHQLFTIPHPKRNTGQISHTGPNVVQELLTNMKKPSTPGEFTVSYKVPLENKQQMYLSLDSIEGHICNSSEIVFLNFTQSGEKSLKPRNVGTGVKAQQNCVGQIAVTKNEKDVTVLKKNSFVWEPKNTKYFSYGHPDHSLRISKIGDDHSRMTFERLHTSQISCATCTDDGKILITGGDDSAVAVWKLERTSSGRKRKINLVLMKRLCGHCDTITCLAASTAFRILISGSRDGACIVWDLNRLQFIRLLDHPSDRSCTEDRSISCLAVNEHNGDIAVCLNNTIYLWSINGALLSKVDTRASRITSVCLSNVPQWYNDNFFVTGHEDGSLKFWAYDFHNQLDHKPNEDYFTDSGPIGISSSSGNLFGTLAIRLHSTKHLNTSEITYIYITNDLCRLYSGDILGTVTCWQSE